MTATTREIVEICEGLPEEKQASVADFARYLAHREDEGGDAIWERTIADERPLPKLQTFLEDSRSEGAATPLTFGAP